jgi:hypothetical protein
MADGEEYRLKIEAYSPDTMPMERLAEYLAKLAEMLGEGNAVHFVRLEPGSTSVVHRIEREAIPKVRHRTAAVRRGIGPRDAVRAYKKINRMLIEDNGTAVWRDEKTSADLIVFPGKEDVAEQMTGIRQHGSIDGEVIRIGGHQRLIPVTLKADDKEITGCWADRSTAKALARCLFEPVRLFGTGRWNRNDDGKWCLDIFRIVGFKKLRDVPLTDALNELREIGADWSDESYAELEVIRNDGEAANGGF